MENTHIVASYLSPDRIIELQAGSKEEALNVMFEKICSFDRFRHHEQIKKDLFLRENNMNTCIGKGIAIPHVRTDLVDNIHLAVGRSKAGIQYGDTCEEPVKICFMIIASSKKDKEYIRVLGRLMQRLKDPHILSSLIHAETTDDIYRLIRFTN